MRSRDRVSRTLTGAAVSLLMAAGVVITHGAAFAQQWDPGQLAVDRCKQELLFKMGREVGGRSPQSDLDTRGLDVRQVSNTEVGVRGRGNYRRDSLDRGRPYTFDCTFNTRSGATRADYRWTGGFSGGGYDESGYVPPPSYRPPPTGGRGSSGSSYPPSGRVFYSGGIINRASGKGLDVQDRSTRDLANVQQWDFGGAPNQSWEVVDVGDGEFSIISQGSNKALDVARPTAADGANVQQYRWHNGDNQRWRLERVGGGFYQIVSVSSGKCLDVDAGQIRENGANVQQWSCSGQPNQHWRLGR